MKLAIPLVSQGELIGLLNLGARLSEQEYSADDRKLLDDLGGQAAPALRVAQLVREQEAEARTRERVDAELRVARLIQENFLPKEAPELPGWQLAAYYRSAREVGGDFYDCVELSEGRIGLVIADVTDKGVPAALVMASTRSLLRSSAQRLGSPGEVLARTNDQMVPDMPPNMFVTCFFGVLDPGTGRFRFANAGHDLPYVGAGGDVAELRATGMPLGLFPGMQYEEKEAEIGADQTLLLHSDGLAEAHGPARDMFGFPRIKALVREHTGSQSLIDRLLTELGQFTGPEWEQEDDVTLVTLHRTGAAMREAAGGLTHERTLAEFELPSEPGNERKAMERVADAVEELALPGARLDRLKTAVAEATMNAIEHGNTFRPELPVSVRVVGSDEALTVQITDRGGGQPIPDAETPDLDAKLAGEQSPRGWGLFLIKNMVDDVRVTDDGTHHTVELILYLKGENDG